MALFAKGFVGLLAGGFVSSFAGAMDQKKSIPPEVL